MEVNRFKEPGWNTIWADLPRPLIPRAEREEYRWIHLKDPCQRTRHPWIGPTFAPFDPLKRSCDEAGISYGVLDLQFRCQSGYGRPT